MKNIKSFYSYIKESVNNNLNIAIEFIKETIKNTKWENKVYIAGGGVRDEILKKSIKDIDLLINYPDGGILFAIWITKKLNIFKENSNPVIYKRFGTAKFKLNNQIYKDVDLSDIEIECVMPRKEIYKSNNRKPLVSIGDLKDDVNRRDFTVNSLLKNLSTGEILDLTGLGISDIKNGIIRTTLDPDIIFTEDPLRMLRAIRFSVKYNWNIPSFMFNSIKKNHFKLKFISMERIQDELNKMLLTKNPHIAIEYLISTNLSNYIFPEINNIINLEQNKYHKHDVLNHTLEVLKNTPPDLITRLSALFHDIGKYKTKEIINGEIHFYKHEEESSIIAEKILKRLKYSNEIINAVIIMIFNHMRLKQFGDDANISNRSLRRFKRDLGPYLYKTLDLIHSDNISHKTEFNLPNQINNIKNKIIELKNIDHKSPTKPILNGNDIIKIFNINKGPLIGKILRFVDDIYLDNPDLTKEEIIELIENKFFN